MISKEPIDSRGRGHQNLVHPCIPFAGKDETLPSDPSLRCIMSKREVSASMLLPDCSTETSPVTMQRRMRSRTACTAPAVQFGTMGRNGDTHFAHDSFSGNTTRWSAGGSLRICAGGGIGLVIAMAVLGEAGLVTGQNMESAGMSRAAGVALQSVSTPQPRPIAMVETRLTPHRRVPATDPPDSMQADLRPCADDLQRVVGR